MSINTPDWPPGCRLPSPGPKTQWEKSPFPSDLWLQALGGLETEFHAQEEIRGDTREPGASLGGSGGGLGGSLGGGESTHSWQ